METEDDPKVQIIQNVFTKSGYKTHIKNVIESILSGNEELLSTIIDSVFIVLNSEEYSPDTKLHSIRAIKDLMSLKQEDVVLKVGEELMPTYLELAQYKSEEKDDDRGKTIFGDDPNNYAYGNSFLRLILESIYVWSVWYPGTFYEETFQALLDLQVNFPKKWSYFKPEDIDISPEHGTTNKNDNNEYNNEHNQNNYEENEAENKVNNKSHHSSENQQHSLKHESLEGHNEKVHQNNQQVLHHENLDDRSEQNNQHVSHHENEENHKESHFEALNEEVEISCKNLENLQERLVEILCNDEENEVKQELAEITEGLQKVRTKHHHLCQEISNMGEAKLEQAFLGKLMDEVEVIDTILDEYEKYINGRITFKTFRYQFSNLEATNRETPEQNNDISMKQHSGRLENKREEEIHSRVESINSPSVLKMNDPFDEKLFQNEVFSSIKSFNENRRKYLVYARSDSLEVIMRIIECCNGIMLQNNIEPIHKFIKEAMDKKNPPFVHGVSSLALDTIGNIASFNYQSKERSRGKEYFGKNAKAPDTEKLSLTYFLLALESIVIWSKWFPNDPLHHSKASSFRRKYEELVDKGVTFPDNLTYFKDLVYDSENIEKDFENIKKSIAENLPVQEKDCNQKILLELMKELTVRLNSEKVMEIMIKIDQKTKNEKKTLDKSLPHPEKSHLNEVESMKNLLEHKLHFERLDQDMKFFKKTLIEYEHLHSKSLSYAAFRQEYLEIYSEKHFIQIKHMQGLYEYAPEPQEVIIERVEDDEEEEKQELDSASEILNKYKDNPMILLVESFKEPHHLNVLLDVMVEIFSKNNNYSFKFEVLLLLKHIMDIRNPEFTLQVEQMILDPLNSFFFEDNQSNHTTEFQNFRRLHQECLLIWSLWYPQIHGKHSKFAIAVSEFYDDVERLQNLVYFDRISYDDFEKNHLSEFCFFHQGLNESLQFFSFLKSEFLALLEHCLHSKQLYEHRVENFLHVFEDVCRHQENFHSNETEENVLFFQNSLKQFEIYQKTQDKEWRVQESFLKKILHAEKMREAQESLQLSPGTSIQKSFLHDSNYFNENEANKIRPSVVSMNYNPLIIKPGQNQNPPKEYQYEEGENILEDEENYQKVNILEHNQHNSHLKNSSIHDKERKSELENPFMERNEEEFDEIQRSNESPHLNYSQQENPFMSHKKEDEFENSLHHSNFHKDTPFMMHKVDEPFENDDHSVEHHSHLNEDPFRFEEVHRSAVNDEPFEELKESHHYDQNNESLNNEFPVITREQHNSEAISHVKEEKGIVAQLQEENKNLVSYVKNMEATLEVQRGEIFQLKIELNSKEKEIQNLRNEIQELKQSPYREEIPQTFVSQTKEKSIQKPKVQIPEKENMSIISSEEKKESIESPYLVSTEDIPLEKEILFPFKNNLEYFSSKTSKQYKGHLVVEDNEVFKDIKQSFQDIKKFKLACLKQKQLIHKGNDIHIGTVSTIQSHHGKNYLRIGVFLTNLSGKTLKTLDYELSENENLAIWSKSSNSNQELAAGGQRKLDVIIECTNLPYKCLKINVKTQSENPVKQETSVCMPTTINKFLKWKNCDSQSYNQFWSKAMTRKNATPYKTIEKKLNLKLIRSFSDLKTYFSQTVEIHEDPNENSKSQKKTSSLGGIFQLLNTQTNILIKFIVNTQEQSFTIKIVETEGEADSKFKEFILRTFMFLIGDNN